MRQLSIKTKVLNSIRSLFKNHFCEYFLYRLVNGKNKESFWFHVLPNHYQYKQNSYRYVKRNGIRFKLDISDIVDWFVYFDLYEKAHAQFIEGLKENDIVIDVGANIGSTGLRFAQLVQNGFVYSFEPDRYNFEKLKGNIELNSYENITATNMAIGNQNSYVKIEQLDVYNRGKNRVDASTIKNQSKIKLSKLDDFALKNNLQKINALKIDVEGYEYEVLKGSKRTLIKHHPMILLELDQNNLNHYKSSIEEVIGFLKELKYSIYVPDLNVNLELNQKIDYTNFHFDVLCT